MKVSKKAKTLTVFQFYIDFLKDPLKISPPTSTLQCFDKSASGGPGLFPEKHSARSTVYNQFRFANNHKYFNFSLENLNGKLIIKHVLFDFLGNLSISMVLEDKTIFNISMILSQNKFWEKDQFLRQQLITKANFSKLEILQKTLAPAWIFSGGSEVHQ